MRRLGKKKAIIVAICAFCASLPLRAPARPVCSNLRALQALQATHQRLINGLIRAEADGEDSNTCPNEHIEQDACSTERNAVLSSGLDLHRPNRPCSSGIMFSGGIERKHWFVISVYLWPRMGARVFASNRFAPQHKREA